MKKTRNIFGRVRGAMVCIVVVFMLCAPLGLVYAQDEVGPEPQVSGPKSGLVPCTGLPGNECTFAKLVEGAQLVINWLLYAAIFFAAILFSWAGFLYVTSAGETGKVERAHAIFKNVAIGFILALAAWLIVHTITAAFLEDQSIPLLRE